MRIHIPQTLALLLLLGLHLGARAQGPVRPRLVHGGQTTCQHVIDLLVNYGTQTPHASIRPNVGSVLLGESFGDLALLQVTMLDPGDASAGPSLAITLRNDSPRQVKSFSVTAVAVFAQIDPWSPCVTQRVKCVAPGEVLELHVTLPLQSLAMGRAGGELLAFRTLVVAIDSFDELVESMESNNFIVLDREKIPMVVPKLVPETSTAPVPTQVEEPSMGPTVGMPADPLRKPQKKIEDIDLDELGIGD